jgi:hypothetical protein
MHMDTLNDLYERGTTPTHHFARVMLLDFPSPHVAPPLVTIDSCLLQQIDNAA